MTIKDTLNRKEKKKIGIILAAGLGSRLDPSNLKPLVSVNNIKLLLRTINSLEIAGCDSIVIVLGWKAEEIKQDIDLKYSGTVTLQYAFNPDYTLQNGISVLCAKPYIADEFILTMADHILDENIMQLVKNHSPPDNGATLCVDYKIDTIFDMDDATKVYTEGGMVRKIGKKIKKYNCIDTGVFIGTKGLIDALATIYRDRGDVSLSEGVQLLADNNKMEVLNIKGCYWQDVDTPEMLEHAENLLKKYQ